MTQEKEMSFLNHLEELRWHLVRSIAAIFIIAIGLFSIQEFVYNEFLLAHIDPNFITYRLFCDFFSFLGMESNFCTLDYPDTLQVLKPTQQLMNSIWSSGTSSSSKIALAGHSGSHSPQSMHSSGSITKKLGPSKKQSTGHT